IDGKTGKCRVWGCRAKTIEVIFKGMLSLQPGIKRTAVALLAALFVFGLASCTSIPAGAVQINLSDAIKLSQSNNITSAVLDTGTGQLTMIASVSGAVISLTDVSGNAVSITNGLTMVSTVGNMTFNNLEQLGF